MKRVIDWFVKEKETIKTAAIAGLGMILIILILFIIMIVAMTEDLVEKVQIQEEQIKVLQWDANYYRSMSDDLMQTYEDVIPKQQYLDDIEYLESIIRELRGDTYNNEEGGN